MVVESFVKSRRGIRQHINERRIGFSDFGVFELLLILADKATGSLWTDSASLASEFGDGSLKASTAKDALHRLKAGGYIKEFRQQGSRGSYPITINKYEITVGPLKGRRVLAEQTVDWRQPATEAMPDDGPDDGRDDGRGNGPPYSRPQDLKTSKPARSTTTTVVAPPEHVEAKAAPKAKPATVPVKGKAEPAPYFCNKCGSTDPNKHRPGKSCSNGKAPVAPAPSEKPRDPLRDWNEDVDGIPAETIRQAIIAQLDVVRNEWYLKNLSVGFVRRKARKLVEDTPAAAQVVKQAKLKYRNDTGGTARQARVAELMAREVCPDCQNKRRMPGTHFAHCDSTCTFYHTKPCPRCEGREKELWALVDQETV